MTDKKLDDPVKDLAEATATGALTLAAGASAATAAIAIAPLLIGNAALAMVKHRRGRMARWFQALCDNAQGKSPEEVRLEVEGNMLQPEVHETIVEAARRLLEAVDDAAAPVLGALTARYLAAGRAPDRFFRGLARLVSDLSAEELRSLRELLGACASQRGEHLELILRSRAGGPVEVEITNRYKTQASDPPQHTVLVGEIDHTLRIFHLLKVHEFGRDGTAGFIGSRAGPAVLWIDTAAARQVMEYLGTATHATHEEG